MAPYDQHHQRDPAEWCAAVVIIKDDADSTVNKGDVEPSATADLSNPGGPLGWARYHGELPKIDATLNAIEKAVLENGDVSHYR